MPVDPTIPAIIGGAFVSKDLVLKLLGPTAEYMGEGLKNWTDKALKNTGSVFEFAAKKLGPRIDEEGGIPPRVLKGILEEAPFADDELTAEYFGGVLASSRSDSARDDRAAALISLLGRLSTYEIRSHYIAYHVVRTLFVGKPLEPGVDEGRAAMQTFIPERVYMSGMDFDEQELKRIDSIVGHVFWGLHRESLIDEHFGYGSVEALKNLWQGAPEVGFIFGPSGLGVELFLASYGKADMPFKDYLRPDVIFEPLAGVSIPTGSMGTRTS